MGSRRMCPNSASPRVLFVPPPASKSTCWDRHCLQNATDRGQASDESSSFPQRQIFTSLDGAVIWIPAVEFQTWPACSRSHHLIILSDEDLMIRSHYLTNLPDLFSFTSSKAFLENCSLNTTAALKAPEAQMALLVYLSLQCMNQAPARKS